MRTTKTRTVTAALRATLADRQTIVVNHQNARAIAASYTIFCRWGDYVPSNKDRVRVAIHNDCTAALAELGHVKSYYYKNVISEMLYVNTAPKVIVCNNARQAKEFMDWLPNRVKK